MPGFKNVLFGGEGLFITTLTGPGTIWLQGMPPDRMISEIARRIPSGGGLGLGIPVGMGGGGGGDDGGVIDSAAEESEGTAVESENDTNEDLIASTDAAVEADRNATIATSGLSEGGVPDAESSSALFGDAAPSSQESSSVGGLGDDSAETSSIPDLEDDSTKTTFSTDDDLFSNDFGEDLTKEDYQQNQQFEDFQQDETTFSSESSDLGGESEGGDTGGSIMDTLWDIFFDGDE